MFEQETERVLRPFKKAEEALSSILIYSNIFPLLLYTYTSYPLLVNISLISKKSYSSGKCFSDTRSSQKKFSRDAHTQTKVKSTTSTLYLAP